MPVQKRYHGFLEDQRAFFDELITDDWDAYQSPEWDFVRRYELQRLFEIIQPATILDVGCGCGFHDREMAEYDFVIKVDGIDYSAASIAKADEFYGHRKVNRRVADVNELQPATKYDLVVSFQVFEHVSKPDQFLKSCHDLCKDGGYVVIFTPNRRRLANVRRWLSLKKSIMLDPQHFHEYTAGEIARSGARCGLVFVSRFGYGMHGMTVIDRMPVARRTKLGRWLPFAAHCICVVMQRRS